MTLLTVVNGYSVKTLCSNRTVSLSTFRLTITLCTFQPFLLVMNYYYYYYCNGFFPFQSISSNLFLAMKKFTGNCVCAYTFMRLLEIYSRNEIIETENPGQINFLEEDRVFFMLLVISDFLWIRKRMSCEHIYLLT